MIRLLPLFLFLFTVSTASASTCIKSPNEFKDTVVLTILSGENKEKIIETLKVALDFDSIAERSLKNHWTSLSLSKKEEFKVTLRDLMVNNYAGKFAGNVKKHDLTWSFKDSNNFSVLADVTREDVDSTLEFSISKTKINCWKISDIIIDEVSIVDNYREQFTVVVVKHGFDHLLAKMKTKIKA